MLDAQIWDTIGFTYHGGGYALVTPEYRNKLCLACTAYLNSSITAFCSKCKAPKPPDWTTGSKSLDSFMMESWRNTNTKCDSYLKWIEFDRLKNFREVPSLDHGCTHTADWIDLPTYKNDSKKVAFKKVTYEQSFNFNQVSLILLRILYWTFYYLIIYYVNLASIYLIADQRLPKHIDSAKHLDYWIHSRAVNRRLLFSIPLRYAFGARYPYA